MLAYWAKKGRVFRDKASDTNKDTIVALSVFHQMETGVRLRQLCCSWRQESRELLSQDRSQCFRIQ